MTLPKNVTGGDGACEQWEWDAIEAARPGFPNLIHTGIKTEQEAEKLARGGVVESVALVVKKPSVIVPLYSTDLSVPRPPVTRRRPGSRAA